MINPNQGLEENFIKSQLRVFLARLKLYEDNLTQEDFFIAGIVIGSLEADIENLDSVNFLFIILGAQPILLVQASDEVGEPLRGAVARFPVQRVHHLQAAAASGATIERRQNLN